MERKVIKQGPNTLMVSLPIKWVKKNKINKGDSINLLEEYNSLIITKGAVKETVKKVEITIKEEYSDSLVRGILSNLYKKGYDVIEVNIPNDKVISTIYKAVNSIMGFEITDQNKDKITIKNLTKELDTEVDSYLRKSFFMLLEMIRVITEDLNKSKYENDEQVKQLYENIRKFTDVCKRSIAKNDVYPEKNKFLYLITWITQKIAKEYTYIYNKKQKQVEKKVLEFLDKTNDYFRSFYNAFYKIKNIDIDYFYKTKDRLYFKESYNLIEKTKNPVIVMHMANIIRLTFGCVNPLIGIEY